MRADYSIIIVGGGLRGSAFAKAMAQNGESVLVLEREPLFRDRIRGEWMAPWGAAEAQKLGLYERLLESCAHESPFFRIAFENAGDVRDFRQTTPQKLPAPTGYHPDMQQCVLDAAREAGAENWCGASVRNLKLS
jgi:menaquinone-9 beta-reductase